MPLKNRKGRTERSATSLSSKVFVSTQILCLFLYLLLFLIASAISLSANFSCRSAFYAAILSFALASFLCGGYAGYKIRKNGISIGLLFCLPANLIVIFVSAVTNNFAVDLTMIISFFILAVASMLGGIVSVNTEKKPKATRNALKKQRRR